MAEPKLVSINEPSASLKQRSSPEWKAFLSLGFRPLYIAGASWALISLAIWVFMPQLIPSPWLGMAWHAHEMLWGFIATIAAAFLLTASATWTGFNPIKGKPLGWLCVLWVLARIGYLLPGHNAIVVAGALEVAFFGIAGIALARVMVKGKSLRNYGVPVLMIGLGCIANTLFLMAVLRQDYLGLMRQFNLGMLVMAILALLIARRVIPFFTMRMVPGLQLPMHTRTGHAQMVLGGLAVLLIAAGQNTLLAAVLAAISLIALWQWFAWKPMSVLHKPLLWILFLGYLFLALGLLYAAFLYSGLAQGAWARPAIHAHIIGIGGFCVLIIGMLTRTALGHLGYPIALDRSMLASYYLVLASFALRLGALWPSSLSLMLLHTATACWIGAFGLYLWRFLPRLIRPRADAAANR